MWQILFSRNMKVLFEVGYIAAKLSKTGKVAFMGGMDVPIIRKFQTGWEEGARYANPDVEFCAGYAGSWGDPAKGKKLGSVALNKVLT